MMLPFSMCCNVCGCYMYRGKKFNSKKEVAEGEDYLGIKRIRFYIKCVECNNEITFKTDPKNSDYECEKVRNLPLSLEGHPHAPCPPRTPCSPCPSCSPRSPCSMHAPCMPHACPVPSCPTELAAPSTSRQQQPRRSRALHTMLSRPARATSPLLSFHTPRAPRRTSPNCVRIRITPNAATLASTFPPVHTHCRLHSLLLRPPSRPPTTNQPPPRTTR